ncbi:MAG: hypothetical protein C0603_06925 [Denitrovibrio sp.]|nr:MAG: hypothetical protein C0603_06925 [Denitrovibrio sp.]
MMSKTIPLLILVLFASIIIFLVADSRTDNPIIVDRLIKIVYPDWSTPAQKRQIEGEVAKPTRDIVGSNEDIITSGKIDSNTPQIDTESSMALLNASQSGNPDVVKSLIRSGVSINTQDEYGNTPLNLAVMRGQTDVVNTLLINGADPDLPNED